MSVTDSVYDYRYENGRRYHAYSEGKYPVPNDEIEKDRLDLQHHAFRLTLDGALYRAPLPKDLHHVLDVGTGTGIWAIEFAEDHPSAEVIGTDLSPIQPTRVPPNCSFLIDDCDKDWIFRHPFDYIHTRAMVAAIKDWDRLFEQAYSHLKPGGYFELQEITFPPMCMDTSITSNESPLLRWSDLFLEAASQIGIDGMAAHKFEPRLRAAGFVNIHAKTYKWPVGRWAKGQKMKLLGRFVYEDLMDWLPSSALGLFTRILKWSREEVELFLATVRRELREEKNRHFYANVIVWYCQRPVEQGSSLNREAVREYEQLESDEERNVRAEAQDDEAETSADEEGDEEEIEIQGTLRKATPEPVNPSIAQPLPSSNSSPPAPVSKSLTPVGSFKDSLISLAEPNADTTTKQTDARQES